MISKEQYEAAIKSKKEAQEVINTFGRERITTFEQRLKDNPIFTDDELLYAATSRCKCGAGMAYPTDCGIHHYWDCSSVLKGMHEVGVIHSEQLPFVFYNIKSESKERGTTRPS